MKILLLIDSLGIGGAETHVYDLALGLRSFGHNVTVASLGGEISERLVAAGVQHIKLCFFTRGAFSGVRDYLKLRALVKKERFDIIHAHSRRAAYVAEHIARRFGVCFLTTAHAKFSTSRIKKYMSRWGYYVCAVSEDIGEYLSLEYNIAPERIRIIANGVDTEHFSPPKYKNCGVEKKIVFLSRLDADCSVAAYALCRAAERLSLRYGKIRISIVGGGSEYEPLSRLAAHMNKMLGYPAIELLGALQDVRGAFLGADVFVGVSRASIEAMACGVNTVLAGNEGFFGEITEENISLAAIDNFCGRAHGRFDEEALFDGVCNTLDLPPQAAERRRLAIREYIKANHSSNESVKKTIELYRYALQSVSLSGNGSCICGYYGFGNVGDDTLLREAIKRCQKRFSGGVSALVRNPKEDRYSFGIRCVKRSNIFSVIREIASSERLIFGGGTLFQDRTSLRSLLYYCLIAEIAQRSGARVELWGNGLGEIRSRLGERALKRVLGRADYIGLRDKRSFEYAKSLGVPTEKITLEEDLAYATLPLASLRARSILKACGARKIILVSISAKTSLRNVREYIKREQSDGVEVIFLVMYPREDKKISEALSFELGCRCISGLSGGEALYICGGAELCISARLHTLIFASMAGCDIIGVGDDPKIRCFCEEKGGQLI